MLPNPWTRSPRGFSNCSRRDRGFPERRRAALAAERTDAHARRVRGTTAAAFAAVAVAPRTGCRAARELDYRARFVRVAGLAALRGMRILSIAALGQPPGFAHRAARGGCAADQGRPGARSDRVAV